MMYPCCLISHVFKEWSGHFCAGSCEQLVQLHPAASFLCWIMWGISKWLFCKMIHTVDDPELAEVLAVRCAVLFAQEHNLQQVIVASDCQNIIKKINSPLQDRSQVGVIVRDVKNLVYGAPVSFIFNRRSCNEAAHVMARIAEQFSESVWCNDAPDAIRAILCNDKLN